MEKAKLELEGKITYDEEHSLYELAFTAGAKDRPVNARSIGRWLPPRNTSGCARSSGKSPVRSAAVLVTRNGDKVTKEKATDVLAYVLDDAKKEFTITRFKGLGEMNPEQLGTPR